jgi:hypothetical protein
MESIIGIRFVTTLTEENIILCSELSARLLSDLTGKGCVFGQILYPYADTLSLSGNPGAKSTRIFGTHLLLRNISPEAVAASLDSLAGGMAEEIPPMESIAFPLTEGSARAGDIAAFLDTPDELPSVGDFGGMLSGYVRHWRIRECARIFASFSEMAYRAGRGGAIGLQGGRLILKSSFPPEQLPAIRDIFTLKTGLCQ